MFAGETVIEVPFVGAGELLFTPFVVFLEYVLFHVLPEFQCLRPVYTLGSLSGPEPLELRLFFCDSVGHCHSS